MSTPARRCSICGKQVPPADFDATFRPFCSQRCRTIDLGGWLDARYRISAPLSEQDLDAGANEDTGNGNGDGGAAQPRARRSN